MKYKFLHFVWSIATQLGGIKLKHINAIFPRYRAAEENHKHCNMFSSPSSKKFVDISTKLVRRYIFTVPYPGFFLDEPVVCLVQYHSQVPPWLAHFSGVFLVHFLHVIFAIFFVIKLVFFVVACIMSNIILVLKGQKIVFRIFLVRSGEDFLEFYQLLIRWQ